jgi:hypothetical protein
LVSFDRNSVLSKQAWLIGCHARSHYWTLTADRQEGGFLSLVVRNKLSQFLTKAQEKTEIDFIYYTAAQLSMKIL